MHARGGMLAIACCCTVSYIACRCAGVCIMLLYDTGISSGISLDKHVGARMSGIFQARAMRVVLEPCLTHASPMLDDTTKRASLWHFRIRRDGKFWLRCDYLHICHLCARSHLKTVLCLVVNRMQARLLLVPRPSSS